ncbi:MAG: hypothetical protein M1823_002696 [Watsoniomyces obsoletus]|nr:MAG: hypothetical protein M1823_002696 [Watsoniomyces obsoletus]
MSLLQNEEFIIYNLRASYLTHIADGVGERLITVNQGVFNTPGFRAAGWHPNPADIKRTYSPPIPTGVAWDYFQAPPRSAGLPPPGFGEDEEEGGMVTGAGASGDTVGPAPHVKRRRRKEQLEEDDSSDLSDESDEEGEGNQRAAQQIRFAKMPVRTRSGSSPIRNSADVGPSSVLSSPPRRGAENRHRRGSLSAVEAIKERARRGTATSSDLSSENELEQRPPALRTRPKHINSGSRDLQLPEGKPASTVRQNTKESTELEDELSGSGSDNGSLSSELEEPSGSLFTLGDVSHPLTSSISSSPVRGPAQSDSPKRSRGGPAPLPSLPPRQPIIKAEPVTSTLSMAIQAGRTKAASPFERFATLSGKGESNPLHLKIYAPFSKNPDKPFEVAIRRSVLEDNSWERKITVVDAIGLSLWRYAEENLSPPVTGDKMNVNRWMMRMVEDGEVDYDFPAIDRTKPLNDFTSNNNRAAQRGRSNSKVFDEFALVEASDEQFKLNEKLTPNPVKAPSVPPATSTAGAADNNDNNDDDPTPQPSPWPVQLKRWNPVLGHDFSNSGSRNNSIAPADLPALPSSHATPRRGPSKILRVHLISAEGYSELVALDVTTDTYLAEVLDKVCKKRNLDKAHHILKVTGTNVIAPLDRTVESLGDRSEIDLVRRRFGNDGSMGNTTPGSTPPNAPILITESRKPAFPPRKVGSSNNNALGTTVPTTVTSRMMHPLAQVNDILLHPSSTSSVGVGGGIGGMGIGGSSTSGNYKRFTVWRKQPMSFLGAQERLIIIDGDYLQMMPAYPTKSNNLDNNHPMINTTGGGGVAAGGVGGVGGGKATATSSSTTYIHLSSVIGCRVSRKHPSQFRLVVYKVRESKRYDFQTSSPEAAAEIVGEINKAAEPFQGMAGGGGGVGGVGGGGS